MVEFVVHVLVQERVEALNVLDSLLGVGDELMMNEAVRNEFVDKGS